MHLVNIDIVILLFCVRAQHSEVTFHFSTGDINKVLCIITSSSGRTMVSNLLQFFSLSGNKQIVRTLISDKVF